MNHCLKCKSPTKNPKFCSRSCAQSYNNALYPKRKPENNCRICDAPIISKKTFCASCKEKQDKRYCTIGEYRNKLSVKGKHPSWIHSHIRQFAKSWNRHLSKENCRNCHWEFDNGYWTLSS